jgi:hypothetical protein
MVVIDQGRRKHRLEGVKWSFEGLRMAAAVIEMVYLRKEGDFPVIRWV